MSEIQRDKLLKENNIDIYPSRSEECYPCIYQMSVRELADIDESSNSNPLPRVFAIKFICF
jgi:hypothetical protein